MALYISQHTLACLTRQGAEELTARLQTATPVKGAARAGKYARRENARGIRSARREELEKWLASEKFHFDWLLRIELESAGGALRAVSIAFETSAAIRPQPSTSCQDPCHTHCSGVISWHVAPHQRPAHLLLSHACPSGGVRLAI